MRFAKHTEWIQHSPDFHPLDYHFCDKMKTRVNGDRFSQPFANEKELKKKIKKVWPEV